jgi:hypothetical protein
MRSSSGLEPPRTGTARRRDRDWAKCSALLIILSASSIAAVLMATPSIPAAHAEQPIPLSKYFGNTFNSTQTTALTITNSTQIVDMRFTARYNGTVAPRVYVGVDYYLKGAEYDVAIGIETDNSGMPSGQFLGAFDWNVSTGFCNGCSGWVYPGFVSGVPPLNHTITLVEGNVYHLVVKYLNGTFTANPPLCYGVDCLQFQYIGGTNFQQESADMHYDPNQAVLYCGSIGTCAVVPGANAVYGLDYNGSAWVQGQTEGAVKDVEIGAAEGGTGLSSYQGERFWMSWPTVSVGRLQVFLSKFGHATGNLNVMVWNFTAPEGNAFDASSPQLVLNQTLIQDISSMPAVSDRSFNFSLTKNVVFQTGQLYQISFAIYGNTTAVGGSNGVGIAVTSSFELANPLNWDGSAGFRYAGGAENSPAESNNAEDLIFIMKVVSPAVSQPITITMSNSAPSANVSVNGCYSNPSTFPSDGEPHVISMIPSCKFTLSFSNEGDTRDGFSVSRSFTPASPPQSSCSAGACSAISLTAYQQLQNTYRANPITPRNWDSNIEIPVSGTQLGAADQTGCSISTVTGGIANCSAWFDYRTQVRVESPVMVSDTEQWIQSGGDNFTQTKGGTQDTVSFIDQFQISFTVTPSGAGSTNPSGSNVWENYGTLPIAATPNGAYLFNSWSADVGGIAFTSAGNASTTATILGSGTIKGTFSAPVSQPITLTLAEPQGTPASFNLTGCSASPPSLPGDGKTHSFISLPSCLITITVATALPNARYSFNSEDAASSTASVTTCAEQSCSGFSSSYYEQVNQRFAYAVSGGAAVYLQAPVLNFTTLGTPTTYTLAGSPTSLWLDFGSSWSLVNPLLGSTGTERWFAPSGVSGTATPYANQTTTYQHQYSILITASPENCGSAAPSGANWEDSGDNFQISSSAGSDCAFTSWLGTGLVTIPQPTQPSTTAFADSNGTLTASFSRNSIPTLPSSTIIAIAGVSAIAVVSIGFLLVRSRRLRPKISPG